MQSSINSDPSSMTGRHFIVNSFVHFNDLIKCIDPLVQFLLAIKIYYHWSLYCLYLNCVRPLFFNIEVKVLKFMVRNKILNVKREVYSEVGNKSKFT